jgi:hypothetical protein
MALLPVTCNDHLSGDMSSRPSFEVTAPPETARRVHSEPVSPQRTPVLRSALKSPQAPADNFDLDAAASTTEARNVSSGYRRGVAFDTFNAAEESRTGGGTGIDFSLTLQAKSEGYERTRQTREFLCATDVCHSPFVFPG